MFLMEISAQLAEVMRWLRHNILCQQHMTKFLTFPDFTCAKHLLKICVNTGENRIPAILHILISF